MSTIGVDSGRTATSSSSSAHSRPLEALGQNPVRGVAAGNTIVGDGTVSGMRRKTSLTLDESTIAAARAGAERGGKPLSQWVEQAILNEVGRTDIQMIEEWERALSGADQAVLAAFVESDQLADLAQ